MQIRTFRNGDLPYLHRLWREHWAELRIDTVTTLRHLEQSVLSRLYFNPEQLLVAELDGIPFGWCQWFESPNDTESVLIPIIVVGHLENPTGRRSVGQKLLSTVIDQFPNGQVIQVGAGDEWEYGYSGLDPVGPGIGIYGQDTTAKSFLTDNGFHEDATWEWFRVDVASFRMPVNREFLQLRRSTTVQYGPQVNRNQRFARAITHLDARRVILSDRSGGELDSLLFYLSENEVEVMPSNTCMLHLDIETQQQGLSTSQVYLVASLIQDAATHHLRYIDLSISSIDSGMLIDQLRSLQFQQYASGSAWVRPAAALEKN